MYYLGFTYQDAYNVPIWQRLWFIDRLQKEINKTNNSKAAHHNDPGTRQMQGRHRNQVPARHRKFT